MYVYMPSNLNQEIFQCITWKQYNEMIGSTTLMISFNFNTLYWVIETYQVPYSRLFSRGKIFANFTNRVQFVKILPLKCFFSLGTLHNL